MRSWTFLESSSSSVGASYNDEEVHLVNDSQTCKLLSSTCKVAKIHHPRLKGHILRDHFSRSMGIPVEHILIILYMKNSNSSTMEVQLLMM